MPLLYVRSVLCHFIYLGMDSFYEKCAKQLKYNSQEFGDCIKWTGCFSKNKYGQFRFRHPHDPISKGFRTKTAHRVALLVKYRNFDVPSYMHASHLCDNKWCINVDHLVFERSCINNARKYCFLFSRCRGHVDKDGRKLSDCLVGLKVKPDQV